MDIISHGLWGSLALGRKSKKSFWLAFFFGIAPDLFSFGPFFAGVFLGLKPWPNFQIEPTQPIMPSYVHSLYNITHSAIIFFLAFALVWIFLKGPLWEMLAWGLHILMDIFTHSYKFFPTPFLWPLSDFKINGWHWGSPWIFWPDVVLLVILYFWFFVVRRKHAGH